MPIWQDHMCIDGCLTSLLNTERTKGEVSTMKNAWISLALVISLLFGVGSSVLAAPAIPSQENEVEAEFRRTIVPMVREKLGLEGEAYRFSLSYYVNPEGKIYSLSWESDKNDYITASVDEDGTILHAYLRSSSVPSSTLPRFPVFSDEEYIALAHKQLVLLAPDIVDQLVDPRVERYIGSTQITVVYTQCIDDKPLINSETRVSLDGITGGAVYYSRGEVYNKALQDTSSSAKTIGVQAAKQAFRDAIGLRLVYHAEYRWNSYTGQRENITLHLRYTWNDRMTNYIHAETGELYTPPDYYSYAARATAKEEMANDASYSSAGGMYDSLTPKEIERLQSLEGVMSPEAAEAALRKHTQLDLPEDIALVGSRYYRDFNDKTERMTLNFSSDTYAANVDINAKTGEVYSFNAWDYKRERSDEMYLTPDELNTIARSFIDANSPGRFDNMEVYTSPYSVVSNSVQYVRVENGIPFLDDQVHISVNPVNKKITSFWQQWSLDLVFPEPKGIVSLDEAYERFFALQEPTLSYVRIMRFDDPDATYGNYPWDVQQVYTVNWLGLSLDAISNTLMQYDAVYRDNAGEVAFDDLLNHPDAEKIIAVARYINDTSSTLYRPDDIMTQGEFIRLFSRLGANPLGDYSMSEDDVFIYLNTMGLMREEDWTPEKELTLLEASKCMVRILNYDSIARMSLRVLNPHNLPATDATYLALASGMQAFDLSTCTPSALLTRAEATVLVYNILAR